MTTAIPRATPDAIVDDVLPGEAQVADAAARSLEGRARGFRAVLPFLGPAFIAAVAYVDPGNFATNVAAGSQFGYMLLWVILVSNLMAMLIQSMSAKLGHRDRDEPSRGVPRALLAARLAGPLDPGRADRHGHGPGRVHRRRARASTCSSASRCSGPAS